MQVEREVEVQKQVDVRVVEVDVVVAPGVVVSEALLAAEWVLLWGLDQLYWHRAVVGLVEPNWYCRQS